MPNAPAHPEAPAEDDHLRSTLTILDRRIESVGSIDLYGPTPNDTAALHAQMVKIYRDLELARENVYFGRLDLQVESSGKAETHYIGRIGFDERGKIVVVDWRAPVARLFSRRRPGSVGYESPDGFRHVELRLKRHVVLDRQSLRDIFDEYDTRPDSPTAGEAVRNLVDPDAYLRQILSGRRDAQMGDIVATIQEHQDELIRADLRQVLLIQGAAGSGKTSVALHRLAYLLYPGNKFNLNPDRCIIFGPNQLFLGYISNVLPGLGIGELPQTTLDTWALERMEMQDRALTDTTLAALLGGKRRRSAAEKRQMAERSRLKGSLRMGQVLERLAQWWRGRIAVPAQGLEFTRLGPFKVATSLSRTRIAEQHLSLRELPVMRHRQRLAEVMLEELMGNYVTALKEAAEALTEEAEEMRARQQTLLGQAARLDEYAADAEREGDLDLEKAQAPKALTQGARGLRLLADYYGRRGEKQILRTARVREEGQRAAARAAVRETLRLALDVKMTEMWPPLEPERAYTQVLGDPALLTQLGRGLLTGAEIDLLGEAAPEAGAESLDRSDLPALLYLHLLSHGLPAALYDHIVVDEAQDAAPLYYAALRRFTRNGSLTILGDLAQGVYAYRGVSSWDEVRAAFEGMPYFFGDMRESYRSTHEIISFANRVLELLTPPGQTALLATPFERHGPPVVLRRLAAPAELAPALAAEIAALQQDSYQNIAVIAKTDDQCAQLAAELGEAGVQAMQLVTGGETPYDGGLVVLPVHLAKGLEFEAVLLAGADEASYPSAEFESRLLYVAVTRALHALRIFAVGAPSALLELAEEGAASAAAPG